MGKGKSHKGKGHDDHKNNDAQQMKSPGGTLIPTREKYLWIFLSAFLFIISVLLLYYAYRARGEISAYDENLTNCSIALDDAEKDLISVNEKLEQVRRELQASRFGGAGDNMVPRKYLDEFKEKGLTSPLSNIKRDLIEHPELIPFESTRNHTWSFYNPKEIYVISPKLVFANISNRSSNGWVLLEYKVNNGGKITWKRINAYSPYYDQ